MGTQRHRSGETTSCFSGSQPQTVYKRCTPFMWESVGLPASKKSWLIYEIRTKSPNSECLMMTCVLPPQLLHGVLARPQSRLQERQLRRQSCRHSSNQCEVHKPASGCSGDDEAPRLTRVLLLQVVRRALAAVQPGLKGRHVGGSS